MQSHGCTVRSALKPERPPGRGAIDYLLPPRGGDSRKGSALLSVLRGCQYALQFPPDRRRERGSASLYMGSMLQEIQGA